MFERTDLTATLVEVAHLYFEENLSQQEIADRLGVSRSLIALYIKKAREQGIVRIEIIDPKNNLDNLARRVAEKFKLANTHVTASAHNSVALTRRALGNAVAHFLDERLHDGDVLGLGWGRTILEVVNLLAPARPRRVDVVPLLGESGYTGSYTQLNQIVLQAAKSFSGTPYFLLAPILVGTKELRDALMRDVVARQVVALWERLTIACVGIGAVPPTEGQVVYIGEENIPRLVAQDLVGDICARYFTRKGDFPPFEFYDRILGVDLEQLRQARIVVAVAGGAEKATAVRAALRTGLISALFVDEALAQILLMDED